MQVRSLDFNGFKMPVPDLFMVKKRDHVGPLLQELHWLPIKQRIIFKILCIVFKSFHIMSPAYISELLIPIKENSTLLRIPRSNSTYGDRAFSSYALKL